MPNKIPTRPQYDLPTAVTFLMAGLALGSVLGMLFFPLKDNAAGERSSADRPGSRNSSEWSEVASLRDAR